MKQVFKGIGSKIIIKEVPEPVCEEGFIKIKTKYTLISSGTETRALTEKDGFLKKIIKKGKALAKGNAETPLGYCAVGEVIESFSKNSEIKKGDKVVCAGFGYAVHAEKVSVPINLVCKVPQEVKGEDAAFAAIASVALHAVRRCDPQLGETMLIIGLGLTGQLVAQLAKLSGCEVMGLDPNDHKIKVAKQLGLERVYKGKRNFKNEVMEWTDHQGVDSVIYCVDILDANQFEEVTEAMRDRGKIVTIGHIKTAIPTAKIFRKEIDLLACRSLGPGRFDECYEEKGNDYPRGYVRWTEKRNMGEIIRLLASKKMQVSPLISEVYHFKDAPDAYRKLLGKKRPIALVLKYD